METKEIDGVLYKLVPEEKEKSCHGCIFKDPDGDFCRIITGVCNKGLIYKKANEPMSDSHLKPFNLEAAKAGKPVCTRDGRPVRIIHFDRKRLLGEQNYPIVALITEDSDTEIIYGYTENGSFIANEYNDKDLMMLPEKKEGWINIYKGGLLDTKSYSSKEEAIGKASQTDYIDTIKIEWEE